MEKICSINDNVQIPPELLCKGDIITETFGDIGEASLEELTKIFRDRAILTTTNADCLNINNEVLHRLPGELFTYESIDEVADMDETLQTNYPV